MRREAGHTCIGAMVAVLAIATAVSLALAGIDKHRVRDMQVTSVTQLRGITQAMVAYAAGNRDYFPGLNADGEVVDVSACGVFQVLLDGNYFKGKYAVSPMEDLEPWQPGQHVATDQISFAILDIYGLKEHDGRRHEWRTTINSQAAILSDRNTRAEGGYASVWTPYSEKAGWLGGVAWGDARASFHTSPEMGETRYGVGGPNKDDHLFESDDTFDALMTFFKDEEGEEKIVEARPVPEGAAGEDK